jgi:hypothetical protein
VLGEAGVTFNWMDYRIKGRDRLRTMTLDAAEFIRRFLLHVLPSGFHLIRHYGLFAGTVRAHNIERARRLLAAEASSERSRAEADSKAQAASPARQCPCCGGRMIVVETFEGARPARSSAPHQDRHFMIAIAVLPASQRRAASLPAKRRRQTSAILTTSADPLRAPRSRQALVCSRSNKLVVVVPAGKTALPAPAATHASRPRS